MEHTPEKKQAERTKPVSELYQNVRTLATVLAVLILIFTFVVRIIVVSGPSMENTLFNGDAMVVWSLGYEPKQGDVVVLTQPAYQEDSIVKRVIAVGGQTVDIDYSAGSVKVDGVPLEEDYIKEWTIVFNSPTAYVIVETVLINTVDAPVGPTKVYCLGDDLLLEYKRKYGILNILPESDNNAGIPHTGYGGAEHLYLVEL